MITYSGLSDRELADLLRIGDDAAFKVIYQKYWGKLLVVAGRRLNDIEEAEEAVQDIFLNLWKRRESFNLKIGFDNYFAVAIKFEVINRLAKRARESQRNNAFAETLAGQQKNAFERFDFDMLQKQLEHTISSLPPKCQLIFRMSREKGETNKKIALELQISEKAVEKHITHALKILKTRFRVLFALLIFFI
ncbi:RNA polymerase sigma-70 factor [Mucilaginibacter sp. UR6-11]|uniref:RNA polymerase sigma-70 factor n=1 Tax=Mucilaginibacter sp. UR6-11 TaxID=1435644 RepID=UPI001E637A35|nr:RNA polymerase sigma-70 factor [Mucilaginibacter sp. UR6-11]MCC8426875.1 RNA polymerase sigma-70 factor [Mucilaginibacter sp. UR6-11]